MFKEQTVADKADGVKFKDIVTMTILCEKKKNGDSEYAFGEMLIFLFEKKQQPFSSLCLLK